MKLRIAKKLCKWNIKRMGAKVIATHGRTFVIEPRPNFLCSRWYAYIIVASNHERLDDLIAEGKMSIPEWRKYTNQHNKMHKADAPDRS